MSPFVACPHNSRSIRPAAGARSIWIWIGTEFRRAGLRVPKVIPFLVRELALCRRFPTQIPVILMAFALPSYGALRFAKMSQIGNNTRYVSATGPKGARANRITEASSKPEKLHKVALLGAAGGIGQPTGLLMSMNPFVGELALYDIVPVTKGVAKDISHCNVPANVNSHSHLQDRCQLIPVASLSRSLHLG